MSKTEDYIKCLAFTTWCSVDSVDRNKAYLKFVRNKQLCMEQINKYRGNKQHSCSLCIKRFYDRRSRNRHRRKNNCINKIKKTQVIDVDKPNNVFKCRVCKRPFSLRSNRDRHQRNMHKAGRATAP